MILYMRNPLHDILLYDTLPPSCSAVALRMIVVAWSMGISLCVCDRLKTTRKELVYTRMKKNEKNVLNIFDT